MADPSRTKFTVYLNRHQLIQLDRDILNLWERYGIRVDRSRYVAVTMALANPADIAAVFIEVEAEAR